MDKRKQGSVLSMSLLFDTAFPRKKKSSSPAVCEIILAELNLFFKIYCETIERVLQTKRSYYLVF